MSRPLHRVESLGVKIGDIHRVTKPLQRLRRYILERGVKRAQFGVAVDDQSMHRKILSSSLLVSAADRDIRRE